VIISSIKLYLKWEFYHTWQIDSLQISGVLSLSRRLIESSLSSSVEPYS
jgi:hypothetical protein